jgi:glycosyltransferase involved in cell wall biosynthesis
MKFKRLGIISDCIHMLTEDGRYATENHIFLKQMEALASYFDNTIICCPFIAYTSDKVISCYSNASIEFISLPNVGGNSIKDKLQLIKTIPTWLKAFKKIHEQTDIVYQRFPNNLNLPGFFYFYLKKAKVFATYTGTWENYPGEPNTYRLQKQFLKRFFRGPVFAYLKEEAVDGKIFKSFSPSYTSADWEDETGQVQKKMIKWKSSEFFQPVFITVGSLVANKNQQYILRAFKILHQQGKILKLVIVGDGPLKEFYEKYVETNALVDIQLVGKKTSEELRALYRTADFLIQAPLIEGFGKVPIEGFFHGVIPIVSKVGVAEEIIGQNERGFLFSTSDPMNLVNIILSLLENPDSINEIISNGRNYSKELTLETWSSNYYNHLRNYE